jgi:MFS family permease
VPYKLCCAVSRHGKFVANYWQLRTDRRSIRRVLKRERIMVLGLSLSTFTLLHVIISLVAIASGFLVMFGLLGSNRMSGMTALFLATTILTSATGFLFPFTQLLPSHMIGIISLVLLAIAVFALYGKRLSGAWRWVYAVTAMLSLYLNVFVLVIQSFVKVPALHALAPSVPPAEPPFLVVQGMVLLFFVIVIVGAARRFRPPAVIKF